MRRGSAIVGAVSGDIHRVSFGVHSVEQEAEKENNNKMISCIGECRVNVFDSKVVVRG